ncbi:hypothetical protein BEP19_16620 [Ammoniphilus oxalaticus]|uniref:SHSP domain-containing protein n=1 Tax=Ammoniphilus oxalaticus TaxID=66863 RepID=A0A419SQZ9_9BACL|nr:Hsp20/alpha crystallin family protein [Ammoniphilus oxalaticus]RKD26818.1 hypothetical protein BEP19_16620 [Ammoniphilus oxalaticus]
MHPQQFEPNHSLRQHEPNYIHPFPEWGQQMGPMIDLYETTEEFIVTCDIPGLQKQDDVDIHVSGGQLFLHGVIQRENEALQEHHYHLSERFYGQFQREVSLPGNVMEENATASYKNGVLEVRLKKAQAEHGKKIEIDFHQ